MSFMEVRAPNNTLISDAETSALKVLGAAVITSSSGVNGTVAHYAFAQGIPWWVIKTPTAAIGRYSLTVRQRDATTLEWFFTNYTFNGTSTDPRPTFVFNYGIR